MDVGSPSHKLTKWLRKRSRLSLRKLQPPRSDDASLLATPMVLRAFQSRVKRASTVKSWRSALGLKPLALGSPASSPLAWFSWNRASARSSASVWPCIAARNADDFLQPLSEPTTKYRPAGCGALALLAPATVRTASMCLFSPGGAGNSASSGIWGTMSSGSSGPA